MTNKIGQSVISGSNVHSVPVASVPIIDDSDPPSYRLELVL